MRRITAITRILAAVATSLLLSAPLASAADARIEGAHRVVAFADVHGAYDELVSVLRETAVSSTPRFTGRRAIRIWSARATLSTAARTRARCWTC